jgi:16S rRNA (cytosine1402-N4)-methyltransferase
MHDMPDVAYHTPVLADQVLELFRDATRVLDGTLGGGGHSEILLQNGKTVVGIDRDPEAIAAARSRLESFERSGKFRTVLSTYTDFAAENSGAGLFDGILLDLGISSHQIDATERGFSFREGAPLDMRMGAEAETAAEFLNSADEDTLRQTFKDFGDEPRAPRLARVVVKRRANAPFAISDDLVGAIREALGPRAGPGEFARLFQAVRIAVNDEIGGLTRALPALRDRLSPKGVFAVITYHSGEDRLVKHSFRDWSAECVCPPKQPKCTCRGRSLGETITRRAVIPSDAEVTANPRSRSAKLRAWRAA